MRPRRLILAGLAVAVVPLVVVPVAWAASDLYANLGPGGQVSPSVDRYPLGNYVLDSHFSALKASLTGGIDASGIPSMIAFFLANLLWQITAFAANAVIALFALAFSIDLLNGSPNTAGAGALTPVGDAIHNLYANTLGQPWMELAVLLAGCWAMWRALIQRRYTETVSALSMSLVFCLLAMAVVAKPDATIGRASRWTNEISAAFLSVTAHGQVTDGPNARRAASDQVFELLIFRPWVALEFGGTEHCIRNGTGSQQHDPESVAVRPLAADPAADAKARVQLHRDGHLSTASKECVDNTVRYPDHFLRYAPGSDDRDAEYDAVNNADPSKLPDSDPTKNTNVYRPAVVDKPITDAMEKGGQYQRLLLALVILLGEIGALLLLGSLCVSVLLAQMVVLLLAGFAPVALVAAIIPGRGHELFKTWAGQLATYLVRKAAYSLVLAVLLAVVAALQDATTSLGWLLSFTLQSMLMWMVFLHRHKLAGQLTAAITGQQPAREAQLRKLLGIAYLARQASPARRRTYRRPDPADGDEADPESGDDEGPEPEGPEPDAAPSPESPTPHLPESGRGHGRPSARRDHGGARRIARDSQPLEEPVSEGGPDRAAEPARLSPLPDHLRRRPRFTKTETELYRNADGHEVWRITRPDGSLVAEDVASDYDMSWFREKEEGLHDVDHTDHDYWLPSWGAQPEKPPPPRPASAPDRRFSKTATELYRNADGREVWRITRPDGSLVAEDVASDHDLTWFREEEEGFHDCPSPSEPPEEPA
jgi:hypothetical protein